MGVENIDLELWNFFCFKICIRLSWFVENTRNFLDYYFRFVKNCKYVTFFIRLSGIDEPWNNISKKSAEYIGVKKNGENRKKSNFWTIFLFLSNLLEYYFRLVSICRYETPCVRSYGVGEPRKKVSQKSAVQNETNQK